MQTPAAAALAFLPLAGAISIWVAWSDLKFMRIPNQAVLALIAVYLVIGPFVLPLPDYLWRMVHFVVVLAFGFVLNMGGAVGAGDAKFAAAMAPFVAVGDVMILFVFYAATLLAAFTTHRLMKRLPAFRRATPDWGSWNESDFPMGLALGGTLIFYLLLCAFPAAQGAFFASRM